VVRKNGAKSTTSKFNGDCFQCGKPGHVKRDCSEVDKAQNTVVGASNYTAACLVATLGSGKDGNGSWYADTGASYHMTSDERGFTKFEQFNGLTGVVITIGNGSMMVAKGAGEVEAMFELIGRRSKITLTNIYYVPELKRQCGG